MIDQSERAHWFGYFIKSILKSLVILAMWLALSGATYSRIALSFALNRIFSSANENRTKQPTRKQNRESDFKAFFKLTNHIAGNWETKKPLFGKFGYWSAYEMKFSPTFYSRKLKSMLHWFIIFEFKLRSVAQNNFSIPSKMAKNVIVIFRGLELVTS